MAVAVTQRCGGVSGVPRSWGPGGTPQHFLRAFLKERSPKKNPRWRPIVWGVKVVSPNHGDMYPPPRVTRDAPAE